MKVHYHLIGIGGAGMSAIAHVLNGKGETVTGSDRSESEVVERLRSEGIQVTTHHAAENVVGADIVVYSAAIPQDNPEMEEARRLGLSLIERPEMLGRLMAPYQHRIAVSGTHGKTTTTSMIQSIFDRFGLDSTALIGGDLKILGGNAKLGESSTIVVEACEAFASFLHLYPSIAVITNIDADHLDFYGTVENVENAFRKFVQNTDENGIIIACWDDMRARNVLDGCGRRIITYGVDGRYDVQAARLSLTSREPTFSLVFRGRELGVVRLGVPGVQNVQDCLAAAAVALEMGVDFDSIRVALRDFHGAGRRFEIMYDKHGIMVVDDYAHHPVELKATLTGAKEAYSRHMIAVFQPHLYSRTQIFLNDFADALTIADEVIVTSIYAAREEPIAGVSGELIVERMREKGFENVSYMPQKEDVVDYLANKLKENDIAILLGAGDIRGVSENLAKTMLERDSQ